MKLIIIRCPETQIPVRTGKMTTPTSFRAMSVIGTLQECPACGKPHRWDSRDAWLIDPEEAPQPTHQFDVD